MLSIAVADNNPLMLSTRLIVPKIHLLGVHKSQTRQIDLNFLSIFSNRGITEINEKNLELIRTSFENFDLKTKTPNWVDACLSSYLAWGLNASAK